MTRGAWTGPHICAILNLHLRKGAGVGRLSVRSGDLMGNGGRHGG
jgi:hypothetical protein